MNTSNNNQFFFSQTEKFSNFFQCFSPGLYYYYRHVFYKLVNYFDFISTLILHTSEVFADKINTKIKLNIYYQV